MGTWSHQGKMEIFPPSDLVVPRKRSFRWTGSDKIQHISSRWRIYMPSEDGGMNT